MYGVFEQYYVEQVTSIEYLSESAINNFIECGIEIVDENVIDNVKQKIVDLNELRKQWAASAKSFVKHKWIYRYITEKQKEALMKHYEVVCNEKTNYSTYKRSFKAICKFVGIPDDKVILENMTFSKDKKDKDQDIVAVKYSKGLVKVRIPEGVRLIHVSPVENIKELIPSFRSKVKGKYMYPTKRCFFTVARDIKPTHAGLEKTKTTRYTPKKKYTDAYIDPTYSDFASGSIYIETESPIPVENYEKKLLDIFKDDIKKEKEEVKESVLDENFKDTIDLIKNWKTSNEDHRLNTFKSSTLSNEDYEMLKEVFDNLHTVESYSEYKKNFDELCKYCHIVPDGVIITKHVLTKGKGENDNSILVEYSANTKKITLPDDCRLYHMSKVANIKELEPFFRGKSERGYLYDKPRIYFTIRRFMPKLAADYGVTAKVHKYICMEDIKEVYVDPLVWSNVAGAVYIETNNSVKVEEVDLIKDTINGDTHEKEKEDNKEEKEKE